MIKKGFEATEFSKETPNLAKTADKPFKSDENQTKRVDINVLKARAKSIQDKENFKNTSIVIFFLIAVGITGFYFSI